MPLLVGSNWILNKSEMCLRRIIRRGYVDGTSNTVVLPNSNLMQMYASIHKPYSQLNSKWKKNALPSCCSFYHYYFFSRVVFCQNYKCNCIAFPQKQTKSQFSRSKVKKNCYCEMISCNAYKMRFKINDQKDVFFVKKVFYTFLLKMKKRMLEEKLQRDTHQQILPLNCAVDRMGKQLVPIFQSLAYMSWCWSDTNDTLVEMNLYRIPAIYHLTVAPKCECNSDKFPMVKEQSKDKSRLERK